MANKYPSALAVYPGLANPGTAGSILVQDNNGSALAATQLNFVDGENTEVNVNVIGTVATITVDSTGGAASLPATNVTTTTQAMVADNAYLANNAALVTLTLPAIAALGTVIQVIGKGAGGWSIAQNVGQSIQSVDGNTTVGVGGSLNSTVSLNSVTLFCSVANTTWIITAGQGIMEIV